MYENNMNSHYFFSKKISKFYKKNVYFKLESHNLTGTHKDRESLELINFALKKNFKKIGCASTGNLAVSLAFYSKLKNLKCYIWLNKNINIIPLLKELGANIYIYKKFPLSTLYKKSNEFFKKNKILSVNPGQFDEKLIANKKITTEILKINNKTNCIVSSVNNGSHILGMSKKTKNIKFYGIYTKSKLAESINSFSLAELKKKELKKKIFLINAKDKNIITGFKLLSEEGLFLTGPSCAIVGSLDKIPHKNICCILSGSAGTNLVEMQKIIFKSKKSPII